MCDQEPKFLGKIVLITGASSGIGATTAIHLASLGASLALVGRDLERLHSVRDQCAESVCKFSQNKTASLQDFFTIQADVSNDDDVKRIIDETIKKFKRLDVLVNCAGIIESGTIETTDVKQYDRIFNVNVRAIYHLTNMAVPYLVETKGNIVNVSSVNGIRSFPGVLAYCMSKAAIDQLTRCSALELAPKQVSTFQTNLLPYNIIIFVSRSE